MCNSNLELPTSVREQAVRKDASEEACGSHHPPGLVVVVDKGLKSSDQGRKWIRLNNKNNENLNENREREHVTPILSSLH